MRILVLLILIIGVSASPIKNVILLCMENHSYDNMLGWMGNGIGDLTGEEYNLQNPGDSSSKKFYVGKGADYRTTPDCPHNFPDVQKDLFGTKSYPQGNERTPNMSGFSWAYPSTANQQNPMNSYLPGQVPIISTLAENFLLFNNWFSSVPGPTDPNKMFLHAATSNGQTASCLPDWYCAGWTINANTIFENLQKDGYSWKIHWIDWNECFAISPLNQNFTNIIQDDDFENFFQSLEDGTLSRYTYLIPRAYDQPNGKKANTQHPSQDIRHGEQLIKEVYEKFRASKYWNDTLLILTYDEHGGFYDHVVPPGNVPNPTPQYPGTPYAFDFTRLGVRVPGILISPWIQKGIDTRQVEHASIPATLKSIFNLTSDYLTARDRNAALLVQSYLKEPRTDCPTILPDVPTDKNFQSQDDLPLEGAAYSMLNIVAELLLKKDLLTHVEYQTIIQQKKWTNQEAIRFAKRGLKKLGHQLEIHTIE